MKHPRGRLSREIVLDAALAIVDEEGLSALSMRRVGEALGVEAMSLYNHVPSKAAMLDGLYERILEHTASPPRKLRTWTEHARHQGRALRSALAAHPNAISLFAQRPATTEGALLRLEAHLAVLCDAGLDPLAALSVVQIVVAYVVGHSLWSLGPRSPDSQPPPDYAALDPHRFPNVRAAAATLEQHDPAQEFETGLDALVLGLSRKYLTPKRTRR